MTLSSRQQTILKAVVTEHVRSAAPIGSKDLVEMYDFGLSPATVRSEMNALERAGFLRQPHTSAGRVPTDLGYRYYVRGLMQGREVIARQRQEVRRRVQRLKNHYEEMARDMAHLLAEMTEQAAITQTGDQAERAGLSHLISLPELKDTQIAQAVAEVFDHPENMVRRLGKHVPGNGYEIEVPGGAPVTVFIGKETGLGRVPMSVLVSSFEVEPGRQGHLVVLGPSRMAYDRHVALLSYMSRLLSKNSLAAIVAVALPTMLFIKEIPTGLS
jgi:transcriptional regulator of heat shock response